MSIDTTTFKLSQAIGFKRLDEIKQLLAEPGLVNKLNENKTYPIIQAAGYGSVEVVKILLDAGADVNIAEADGTTTLHHVSARASSSSGKPAQVVKILIAAGANVNAKDKDSWTPIRWAVTDRSKANLQIVEALIAAGADVNVAGKVTNVLLIASDQGSPEMLKAMIAAGAKVNAIMPRGTALIRAAGENRADNVAVLLENGADPHLRLPADFADADLAGKTALDVAHAKKAKKVIPLLETATGQSGKAPAAKKLSIAKCWKRIEAWLAVNNPDLHTALKPPARDADLSKLETVIGAALPDDFKKAWKIHNGNNSDTNAGLIPPLDEADGVYGNCTDPGSYYLMPCSEIIQEWQNWKGLVDSGEFADQESGPDKGIQSAWWHPGWVPFASNGGGDSICIDLAPTAEGTVGQVISMNHDSSTRELLAPSFGQWLAELAESVEENTEE